MHHALFAIDGMDSESCANRIRATLADVRGVRSVEVMLDRQRASVQFDDRQATPQSLADILAHAGYRARPLPTPRSGCTC